MKTVLKANQPIGVFDSGVGGLSVLKHINALMPNEPLIYVADSLYAPYGNKTESEIQARCLAVADVLMEQSVKAMVVACNTATTAVISTMRDQFSLPIIGMEPAVKPAVTTTRNGKIGVLATSATLKSTQFSALLASYGSNTEVFTQACDGLVEQVEQGALQSAQTKILVEGFCAPLIAAGVDTIVLGCTHYPFLKTMIQRVLGNAIQLIDTGAPVAKQLQRRLMAEQLVNQQQPTDQVNIHLLTNSQSKDAMAIMAKLWGNDQHVIQVTYQDF